MHNPIQLIYPIHSARNSLMRPLGRCALFLVPFAVAVSALSPMARAVDPPPDGGYENQNTAEGEDALFSLTFGFNNTAIGYQALFDNTIGNTNTAIGAFALDSNTTGSDNTATGVLALNHNTSGDNNTATGHHALNNNTTGANNTANGVGALSFSTTGSNNTANGLEALYHNTTGGNNTATGVSALTNNTTGTFNAANGIQSLNNNTTGTGNVADGSFALFSNTVGISNVGVGFDALYNNTTGGSNIAVGVGAGVDLTTGSNNIDIGNRGVAAESGTIRIGTSPSQTRTFIAGINGAAIGAGVTVRVNASGQLGTQASSARFKEAIKPMDKASEAIHALKPVTFRYKKELDPEGIPQFGLVAEEVAKVHPDLVVRDKEGKPYTVCYEAVNAMLLNEFLKEHRKVEDQQATIAELKSALAEQQKKIESLTSGLQKVSDQLATQRLLRLVVSY
jgi:hypothetical protein